MTNNLFKTKQTAANTYVYVHAQQGSDITGDGSINKPYASLLKAHSVYPSRTKLLRGTLTENPAAAMTVQGDEMWQTLLVTQDIQYVITYSNMRFYSNFMTSIYYSTNFTNCISALNNMTSKTAVIRNNIYMSTSRGSLNNVTQNTSNNVIVNFTGLDGNSPLIINNSIMVKSIIAVNTPLFKFVYTVFSSRCVFYWGNSGVTPVPAPVWGNDPVENVRMLKRAIDPSWIEFGGNTPLDDNFGTVNIAGQKFETCRIVLEEKDGGTLH
jgi:hypothetical protein